MRNSLRSTVSSIARRAGGAPQLIAHLVGKRLNNAYMITGSRSYVRVRVIHHHVMMPQAAGRVATTIAAASCQAAEQSVT
jgi:hypothetical protein